MVSCGTRLHFVANVTMSEQLFFGNFSNWHRHLEGNIALILQRGPEGFMTDSAHQIFTDSRILAVCALFSSSSFITSLISQLFISCR